MAEARSVGGVEDWASGLFCKPWREQFVPRSVEVGILMFVHCDNMLITSAARERRKLSSVLGLTAMTSPIGPSGLEWVNGVTSKPRKF